MAYHETCSMSARSMLLCVIKVVYLMALQHVRSLHHGLQTHLIRARLSSGSHVMVLEVQFCIKNAILSQLPVSTVNISPIKEPFPML